MMDWTDRHCRFFHRQLSRHALLYTEMVTAEAILHGDVQRLLGFDAAEHPIALQLGGSDPQKLARASQIGEAFGHDEINLNVGCPSDRVQSGTFGACLMRTPELVGECIAAMKAAVSIPVTVKCRLGVDEQDTGPALDALAQAVWRAGADGLWVHARKAWLQGLSPKENREIPPLDHDRVRRLKLENPLRFIGLNGGLENPIQAFEALNQGAHNLNHPPLDGAMLGRAAYHNPGILRDVDRVFHGENHVPAWAWVMEAMMQYAARHIADGGRLIHVTRHMTGLFHGLAGARRYRQILSSEAAAANAGPEVIARALGAVRLDEAEAAA
jgi:tRNA-dihydrouridine synthase A